LTVWVAAVMIVSAAVLFVVVYQDTGAQIRGQIDGDITGDVSQLAQALRPAADSGVAQISQAARRYLRQQPYTATSTLLLVLIPGAPIISNHLELFGAQPPEPGETSSTERAESHEARRLLIAPLGYSSPRIPDVGSVRLLERALRLGSRTVVVGAAEPLALVERAQHGVARAFALAGAIVLVLALFASYLAGARVSAPLRRMAAVAARVDAGELGPRMALTGGPADELRVLADSFNHMLDRLAEAFASQRDFVADASHELRTPLTVIRGQLEVLAAQSHPSEDEVRHVERQVQAEVSRVSRLVDDLLVLTQAERSDFLRQREIDVRAFVPEVWDGLSLTAERRFELGDVPNGTLNADPDRVAQALRNLGRNAIEHTEEGSGLVRLEARTSSRGTITFSVIDDGPGIPAEERERIFERFHRVDSGRSRKSGGTGLGLAIVRAIAEAHGGSVNAGGTANGHGTRVEFALPGFRAKSGP
jgi:two-component system, OmpR family, sensor kinase